MPKLEEFKQSAEGIAFTEIMPRLKAVAQHVLTTPEINTEVIVKFLKRKVRWDIIKSFEMLGEDVICKICGKKSKTGFWCRPCIHPDWCCYCCILMGIPGYE